MAEPYTLLKTVHQTAAALSIAGFMARGTAALRGAAWVRSRAARTLPHVVDTLLLATALVLAWMAGFTPGNSPWLLAKIVALLVYIGLGMLALKPGRPWSVRALAFVAAIAVFAYIVSAALSKRVSGFWGFWG